MTVKELIEELSNYDKDTPVLTVGDSSNIHYEISETDLGYDIDYEKDVVLIYNFYN